MKVYYFVLVMCLVFSAIALPNQSFRIRTKGNNPLHHRAIREVEEMAPDFEIIDLSLPDRNDSTQNCIDCEDKEILSNLNQRQLQRLSLRDAPIWNHEQSGSGDGDSEDSDANEDLDSVTETAIERPKVYKEINRLPTTVTQLDETGKTDVDSNEMITNLINNVPQTTEASENPGLLGNSKQTEVIHYSKKSRLFPDSPFLGLDHTVAASKHREFDDDYEVQETDVDYAKIEYSSLTEESEDNPTMQMLSTTGLLTTESDPKTSSAEEDSSVATEISPSYCTVPKEMVFVMLSPNSLTKEQGTNATMECQVLLKDIQLVLPDAMIEWTFIPAKGPKCSLGPNSHLYQACDNRATSITTYNNTSASLLNVHLLTPNHTGLYACCVSWECNPGVTMGSQMRVEADKAILLKVYDKPEYYYQIGVMSGFCGLLILLLAAFCYINLKNSSRSQVLYNVQSIESPIHITQATDSQEEQAPLVKKDSQFSKLSFVSDDEEEEAKDDV